MVEEIQIEYCFCELDGFVKQLVNIGLIINNDKLIRIINVLFLYQLGFWKSLFGVIIYDMFNMFLEYIGYIKVKEISCLFNYLEEFFVVFQQ